jgi:hypothetical protein
MKAGFSLPRFIELSLIGSMILLIAPIASTTAVVKQKKTDTGECSLLDSQQPGIYLIRDTAWNEPKTIRMILRNNSSCSVTLTIAGNQTIAKPGAKISQPPLAVAEDGESVVLRYKVNSVKALWAFIDYWHWVHGDDASTITLKGGHSIKFVAPAEYLQNGRRIAVPFNYEWEGFSSGSGVEHVVYFPID